MVTTRLPGMKGSMKMRHEPTSGYEDPALNYRVTWKSLDEDDDNLYEEIFTSRDQGWDFYQAKKKSARAYGATFDHIRA